MGFKVNIKENKDVSDGFDTIITLLSDEAILGSTWHERPSNKETVTEDICKLIHELGIQ